MYKELTNAYIMLVAKPEGKRPFGRILLNGILKQQDQGVE
jgi:hypothetical protein